MRRETSELLKLHEANVRLLGNIDRLAAENDVLRRRLSAAVGDLHVADYRFSQLAQGRWYDGKDWVSTGFALEGNRWVIRGEFDVDVTVSFDGEKWVPHAVA